MCRVETNERRKDLRGRRPGRRETKQDDHKYSCRGPNCSPASGRFTASYRQHKVMHVYSCPHRYSPGEPSGQDEEVKRILRRCNYGRNSPSLAFGCQVVTSCTQRRQPSRISFILPSRRLRDSSLLQANLSFWLPPQSLPPISPSPSRAATTRTAPISPLSHPARKTSPGHPVLFSSLLPSLLL